MGSVNQIEGVKGAPKLSDVLFEKRNLSFASLAPLPSNVEAIESGLLFSTGLSAFVALVGPTGWGKTHLLSAVSNRLREAEHASPVVTAEEYLAKQPKSEPPGPLILDDCEQVLGKTRPRAVLRLALEQRVRAGRPTLVAFTSPKVTRQVKAFLPSAREWTLPVMDSPEPAERILLINHMASAEGLALSPNLVRVIAHQMHGNGRTLSGALKRLRLSGGAWLDSPATLRACGLLDPFFADNGSWDLKHKILRTSESSRAMFSRVSTYDLAVFTMLRVASLSEADVARAVGVEPAEAYLRASRFAKEIERDSTVAGYVKQFVDVVVASLAHD